MGHVTGGGAWRGCGDAGGVGGVLSERLARGKSFFQKTLRAARGAFWRVRGGLGDEDWIPGEDPGMTRGPWRGARFPRLGRVEGRWPAARHGLECGAGFRRMGRSEGRVDAERPGTPGRVMAARPSAPRAHWRTKPRLCRRAPQQRREGQHELKEDQQDWEQEQHERCGGHWGAGCDTYTSSVPYPATNAKPAPRGGRAIPALRVPSVGPRVLEHKSGRPRTSV